MYNPVDELYKILFVEKKNPQIDELIYIYLFFIYASETKAVDIYFSEDDPLFLLTNKREFLSLDKFYINSKLSKSILNVFLEGSNNMNHRTYQANSTGNPYYFQYTLNLSNILAIFPEHKETNDRLKKIIHNTKKDIVRLRCAMFYKSDDESSGINSNKISMVLRIIDYNFVKLADFNFPQITIDTLKKTKKSSIIAGKTGSGKSTLLAGVLREMLIEENNIHLFTVENPIEYPLMNKVEKMKYHNQINRIDISKKNVKNFQVGCELATRVNPNLMLLGEINNQATLLSFINLARQGTRTFTTIHASSSFNIINRIMGILNISKYEEILSYLETLDYLIYQELLFKNNKLTIINEILTLNEEFKFLLENKKINEAKKQVKTYKKTIDF